MHFKAFALLALITLTPQSLAAQDQAIANGIVDAFWDWADTNDINQASIAVGYDGTVLVTDDRLRTADRPYPIASLSKAITATCLARALDAAGLTPEVTLGDLSDRLSAIDLIVPDHASDLSLAALMTMTAGLSPDITQGTFNRFRNHSDTRNIGYSRDALKRTAMTGTVGQHDYNNGNYAILGAVLEALLGADNVTGCDPFVFEGTGVTTGGFNDDWISLAAFGGWEMSATDYLRFVMHNFGPDSPLVTNILERPNVRLNNGAYYGMGTYFRLRDDRVIFWHFGTLCLGNQRDAGAYFAYYENGYAVAVNYHRCLSDGASRALDHALWTAGHQ